MGRGLALIYPTFGHVSPALAVVEELISRGEEIEFHGTARWRDRVTSIGASFQEYAAADDEFNPDPPTDGLLSDMSRLLALTERLLPALVDRVRDVQPDYLLLDTKSLWGRLAGQATGVPAITLSVVFAIRPELVRVSDLVRWLYGRASSETLLNGLQQLERYGQTARRLAARHAAIAPGIVEFLGNPQPLNVVFASRAFQIEGDRFGAGYEFVGASFREQRQSETAVAEVADGVPLVYVSLGTTFNDAPQFYETCFEAFVDLPCRAIVSTGGRSMTLQQPPANVTVQSFVPQLEILQRADAFVTHGGMNSANEGLFYGVPMIVVPQRGDQHLVASRVAELGAGLALQPRDVTAARLREAITRVLVEPSFRANARALGRTVRDAGGYVRAADVILAHQRALERNATGSTAAVAAAHG